MSPELDKFFDQDIPTIKEDFENLTMVEDMLISPVLAKMSVYRLSGGQLLSRGNTKNLNSFKYN